MHIYSFHEKKFNIHDGKIDEIKSILKTIYETIYIFEKNWIMHIICHQRMVIVDDSFSVINSYPIPNASSSVTKILRIVIAKSNPHPLRNTLGYKFHLPFFALISKNMKTTRQKTLPCVPHVQPWAPSDSWWKGVKPHVAGVDCGQGWHDRRNITSEKNESPANCL